MSAFKIKQIFDHSTPLNLMVMTSVKKLLLSQFPYMKPSYLEALLSRVTSNKSELYKHYLFIAEKKGAVIGAAIASHFLKENFFFIDYIALGLDTAKGDPTGSWKLMSKDFEQNGFHIGLLKKPTLVIQEGGYKTQLLGINARHFFQGLTKGYYQV